MNVEELYERNQVLSALGSVLLHDLRNPLHSATLLVEAMGLRTSDLEALRDRLRGQLAKLDALISEAAGPMRELALEPRIGTIEATDLLADVLEFARQRGDDLDNRIEVVACSPCTVSVDRRIVGRAIGEVVLRIAEAKACSAAESQPTIVRMSVQAGAVLVTVEGFSGTLSEAITKAPFAIAGGGIGLALARALAQLSGATLQLHDGAGPSPKFVFGLPRA
jgi:signal transduction histidine kinase